jgi:hypothetical protein
VFISKKTGIYSYSIDFVEFYFLNRVIHLKIVAGGVIRCEKNDFIERGDVYFIEGEVEYFFYKSGTGMWDEEGAHIF